MNKDQVKGAIKEATGKVQQKTGEAIGSARATPMRAAAKKYSESPTTIEHRVDPTSNRKASGGAAASFWSAPVGQAYAPSSAAHSSIRSTLERHSARWAIGRIATDVSAQATARPIATSSPTPHLPEGTRLSFGRGRAKRG